MDANKEKNFETMTNMLDQMLHAMQNNMNASNNQNAGANTSRANNKSQTIAHKVQLLIRIKDLYNPISLIEKKSPSQGSSTGIHF